MFSIGVKPFCGAWHILVFSTDNKIKDDEMTVLKHLTKRLKVSVGVLAVGSTLVGSVFAKNDINIDYEKFTTDNGLTVIVHEDRKAPVVAVAVWYKVGSKDEPNGKSGFAHLFEHLMFNGTENYDDEWFGPLQEAGATGLNGTTNFDRTNYFQTVPTPALDRILWMESDRMGHLLGAVTQEKLDEQRGVVQNEKRQGEDQPYGSVFTHIFEGLFPIGHPYHHTVIGSMEDLNSASLDDVKGWFNQYYGPNNAILVLSGDINAEEAKPLVNKYFADIEPGPALSKWEAWVPKRNVNTREVIQDKVPQSRIYRLWVSPENTSSTATDLFIAASVIGDGKNSRLYKEPGAILATNTSTLDVNRIASFTKRPEDVVGMHFFSPANVMKLLENVRGEKTSDEVVATVMDLSRRIGKVGVLVGVCHGFVGNRMLHKRQAEAVQLVNEGANPAQVDKVLFDLGFPMGPFAMSDLAGMDVGYRIREELRKEDPDNAPPRNWTDDLVEQGRLGQKTQAGVFDYKEGDRTPVPSSEVDALIAKFREENGIQSRDISDQEILERCMYIMVNEGAKILEEGIAARPLDVDVIWIYGYGFPVYRGGVLFWADSVGLKTIYDKVSQIHQETGSDTWKPAALLEKLAKEGKGFYS